MALGIDGFTYADLHQPARLRDLHVEFSRQTAAFDPPCGRNGRPIAPILTRCGR
jgi:hypothetical protein